MNEDNFFMLTLKPITLEDKELFDNYIHGNGYTQSEASFANLYIWKDAWEVCVGHDENAVYVSMDSDIYRPFLMAPFRKDMEKSFCETMEQAREYMTRTYGTFYMKSVPEGLKNIIQRDCGDAYEFRYDEYNSDYVYNIQDLIELRGKKYHGKKNHINKFLRTYTSEFDAYTAKDREACLAVQRKWASLKQVDEREAEEEYRSIERALDKFDMLGLVGCVVRIGGEVVAFSIGERITEDTALIHIEKADDSFHGLYPYINREFLANFFSDLTYVNREEDMGVPGIRQAKRSYHPAFMIDKYDAVYKP
ncbi:MAG: DUF2156 domain-containing protein [Christensenellaceae bacterium]